MWIAFKYERISDFCYGCEQIDHTLAACACKTQADPGGNLGEQGLGPWMWARYRGNTSRPSEGTTVDPSKVLQTKLKQQKEVLLSTRMGNLTEKITADGQSKGKEVSDTRNIIQQAHYPLMDITNQQQSIPIGSIAVDPCPQASIGPPQAHTQLNQEISLVHLEPTRSHLAVKLYGQQPLGPGLVIKGKRKSECPQTNPRQKPRWNAENMNVDFANIQIQPQRTSTEMDKDEEVCQHAIQATVVTEEQILVVRRRFIHVKRMARNKNRIPINPIIIEEIPSHSIDNSNV